MKEKVNEMLDELYNTRDKWYTVEKVLLDKNKVQFISTSIGGQRVFEETIIIDISSTSIIGIFMAIAKWIEKEEMDTRLIKKVIEASGKIYD